MFELGKKQTLTVMKRTEHGVYLGHDGNGDDKVLLPKNQVDDSLQVGSHIEVFIYKDSEDRIIATVKEPYIMLGEVRKLKVVGVSHIGAFLDWGLDKDLFLPFKEQTRKVIQGEEVLAALYIDKSERLCATMNVYEYLEKDSPYKADDIVTGTVYETSRQFGVFVAVDDRYSALIPAKEVSSFIKIGSSVTGRVTRVKPDGKLDISVRRKAYKQMDEDAQSVYMMIQEYGGVLPFTDKADAELIKREAGLSKNAFKRAVGRLLKEGRININEKSITLIKND